MAEVRTTCPYCGTGCGLVMSEARDGWAVGGDPEHPANLGRICSKGAALPETLPDEGRLLHPEVDGRRVGWDEATTTVAARLRATIAEHGPDSVAFYVSGQLLTEDYYVANKLLKGFIGSPHIDTNSRLCMASTVAGHRRAFGADVVPGCYEDLELADLMLLVGSNLTWCHPVLHQRLMAARRTRGTIVVTIDPRRTATADEADLHLAIRPGTDVALFNGLLAHLADAGACDAGWVAAHVGGYEAALADARADAPSAEAVARRCGLRVDDVETLFRWVRETPRTVTVFSQGVNQSSRGTDKVNAILNLHLATARIGRPGAGPLSVTGQPNAMGGREVGGLANQLAAHMDPNDPADVDRVRRFWRAPMLKGGEGLKAVDLFRAVESGRIRALWVMATNPAVSLPEAGRVRAALARCPLVIVSDVVARTDTLRFAHIRLPASAWGEKSGTVTNSERRISRQRPFRSSPGEARPDWWIMAAVGRALGHGRAFRYRSPADVFREHAALSAFENGGAGRRAFDIGACARLSNSTYERLESFRWPWPRGAPREAAGRLYADGRFHTPDGRARMVPVITADPAEAPSRALPLVANSGRYRDQWHTMTRTGIAPRLAAHRPEPLLEIAPADARACGVEDGDLARVENARGHVIVRVAVSEAQPPGQVFLPIHWSDANSAATVVGRLVGAHVDPVSGQPESKHVPVRVRPAPMAWAGLLLTRREPDLAGVAYWCRQAARSCAVYELAGTEATPVERLVPGESLAVLDYRDAGGGVLRRAWLDAEDRLVACLFLAPARPVVAREWLRTLFAGPLDAAARRALLAGRAAEAAPDQAGEQICACFGVGLAQIEAAIREARAASVAEVGRLLSAGTGCGSCIPEIREILRHERSDAAA